VNFQYPVVASGCGGEGAVSCSHSRTTTSSWSNGEEFITAWASVEGGVYGFVASSSRAEGVGGGSVFRAGRTACSRPQVFSSSRRISMSSGCAFWSSSSWILIQSIQSLKALWATHWSRHNRRILGAKPSSGSSKPARSSFRDWLSERTSADATKSSLSDIVSGRCDGR
jgi:hypothetical protein